MDMREMLLDKNIFGGLAKNFSWFYVIHAKSSPPSSTHYVDGTKYPFNIKGYSLVHVPN
jgi:hypothetical protein